MITLTVLQVLQSAPAIQALAVQPHKGRVAFRIRRLVQALQPLIQTASASQESLFTAANSVVLANGRRQIRPECTSEYLKDPLFAETVEVNVEPLSQGDLEDAMISPEQLDALGPLLEDK